MTASNRGEAEPPMLLDGAQVLEYASFDASILSGGGSAVVGGVAVDLQNVAGLAIVEDLARGAVYLLSCNRDWQTVAAAGVPDAAAAKAQAEVSFPGVRGLWREFRELGPEERAEIESTRRFLRELIAGDDGT
jgi:hypothetical protein